MNKHVHLLATPAGRSAVQCSAVPRMMQSIRRRYVGAFNLRYRRTGTLWEGRFKAALVDSDRHLLTCHRHIELNPVRAAMVCAPADYRWSSYGRNALGAHDPRVSPHTLDLQLGADDDSRRQAYRQLFTEVANPQDMDALRTHTRQQRAWGSEAFRCQIEELTRRAAGARPRGRPRRGSGEDQV